MGKDKIKQDQGPIIFDDAAEINIEDAPHIDAEHTAMGVVTTRAARRTGWLGRIFIAALTMLIGLMVSLAFWDFANGLLARNERLGQIAFVLMGILLLIAMLYMLRELWAIMRLTRVDRLRQSVHDARIAASLEEARKHTKEIVRFYHNQPLVDDHKWREQSAEITDAEALLEYTERQILAPLDQEARREIEKRARQVAMVTAFVPLALADLIVVLSANIGMIRRIAEIYGGRPGIIGGWRLFRKVALHLVATGAVAVGDDVIGSVMGGSLLGKISRRFGEGIINAALSARVGVAAIEVCRPMEFDALSKPSVSELIPSALAGFVKKS